VLKAVSVLALALPVNSLNSTTFPKAIRLRQRADYVRLTQTGLKVSSKFFILLIAKDVVAEPRVGLTVSRKVGCAVVRNRVKRYLREFLRRNRDSWPNSDFVVIARSTAAKVSFDAIMQDLISTLQRVIRR
jgi:ribonuclease P protein component